MAERTTSKSDLQQRLRRIEGQVRGIAQMVEDDRYCIDLLTQVSAATRALQAVAVSLLDDHLRTCVADAVRSDADAGRAKLDEAAAAIERLVRS
jgi:DNA-binding FrmR family transcriptional regulator